MDLGRNPQCVETHFDSPFPSIKGTTSLSQANWIHFWDESWKFEKLASSKWLSLLNTCYSYCRYNGLNCTLLLRTMRANILLLLLLLDDPPVSHNHCTGVPSPWNFLKNLVMAIKTHVILHILAVNSNVLKLQRNSSMLRMHAKIVYIYWK